MANRVILTDDALDIHIELSASGSYAPDIMADLTNRALDVYRSAVEYKVSLATEPTDDA